MDRATLDQFIAEDEHGLLEIHTKGHFRIYGRINGQRGGTLQGLDENNVPIFGGANLIYAPVWWNRTWQEVAQVCDKILAVYPECECYPQQIN